MIDHNSLQTLLPANPEKGGVSPAATQSFPALPSEQLLRGKKKVAILHNGNLYKLQMHNGNLYKLQTTKLGKLVLTK